LGLLAAGAEPGEIRDVLDATLAPLADLDEERRDRHLATRAAWFDQDGSVKRTARALGVHVNTVYGRLAGLDELFGPGWRRGRRRLELETSVRLQLLGTDLGSAVRNPQAPSR
jgi:sugar diacid utilization regulator